jgi:hypothetical protein
LRIDGLNAGYASALFEQYLENPAAVPTEWRALFESGASELVATHPGLARLVELLREDGNGHVAAPAPPAPVAEPAPPAPAPVAAASEPWAVETEARPVAAPDETLLAAVAAAMALVTAHRTHGHLAARLDPLGSEPVGDPALEPERREPKLTEELQELIPAEILGVHVPGDTLADVLPQLRDVYCGTSAYEIEHISDHEQRVWLRTMIESRGGESIKGTVIHDEELIELGRAVTETLGVRGPCTVQAFRDPEIGLGITDVNTRFGGAFPAPMYAALPGRTYPELIVRMARGERVEPHVGEFRHDHTFTRWYWQLELDDQLQPTGRDIVDGGPRVPR